MIYHVSGTAGLTVLEPRVSTHGKAWVYAIENKVTGLLFGAKMDDFDLHIHYENDIPVVAECYPNAMETVYRGKRCAVYELEEGDFQRGMTGWRPELVCDHAVPVLSETAVEDLYAELLKEEKAGNIIFHRYEHTAEYKKMIAEHITDRLIRFGALNQEKLPERLETHYGKMIAELRLVMDGHLLE